MDSVRACTRRRTSSSHSAAPIALLNTALKAWERAEKEGDQWNGRTKKTISERDLKLMIDWMSLHKRPTGFN